MESKKSGRFTSVNIPTILIEEIDKLLLEKSFLYTTKADFITDAVRKQIMKIKKEMREEKFPKRNKGK